MKKCLFCYYFILLRHLHYFPTHTAGTALLCILVPHSAFTYLFTYQLILAWVTSSYWSGVLQHPCARSKMFWYVLDISAFEKWPLTALALPTQEGEVDVARAAIACGDFIVLEECMGLQLSISVTAANGRGDRKKEWDLGDNILPFWPETSPAPTHTNMPEQRLPVLSLQSPQAVVHTVWQKQYKCNLTQHAAQAWPSMEVELPSSSAEGKPSHHW